MQFNENDNSSVESWPPTIKQRWRFSVDELRVLEESYKQSANPRQETIDRLSYTLQCPKKTVTTWFQNRRAKLKRQRLLQERRQQHEKEEEESCLQKVQLLQQPLQQQYYYSPVIGYQDQWLHKQDTTLYYPNTSVTNQQYQPEFLLQVNNQNLMMMDTQQLQPPYIFERPEDTTVCLYCCSMHAARQQYNCYGATDILPIGNQCCCSTNNHVAP